MPQQVDVLGAVRRGGGDAGWQQSRGRTVFALLSGEGAAGPLLERMQELPDPTPEGLAETARDAGLVSAASPMLLGVIQGAELVLFGAGGAVCRLERPGAGRDLLESGERASYSTGQALLRSGDVLLCAAGSTEMQLQGPLVASGLPATILDSLSEGDGASGNLPVAVLRLGQPSSSAPPGNSKQRPRTGLLPKLLLLLAVAGLIAAALLLPWRQAVGLSPPPHPLPPESDVLVIGGDSAPEELGRHLRTETAEGQEGLEEGTYLAAETAPNGITAVERIVVVRDADDPAAAGYLTGELNPFQRGRTVVVNQTGRPLSGPLLDRGQFALYADLQRRRGGNLVITSGGEVTALDGGEPEPLAGPEYRAVVVR